MFNSTRWDCAYIWHSLPPRPVDAPQTSLESMIWSLHHDFGLISDDVFKNEGHAAVEVLHRNGEPLDGKFVLLGRLAALSRDDIGCVRRRACLALALRRSPRAYHVTRRRRLHLCCTQARGQGCGG